MRKLLLCALALTLAGGISAQASLMNGSFQTEGSDSEKAEAWDGVAVGDVNSAVWGNIVRADWPNTADGDYAVYLQGWLTGNAGIWQSGKGITAGLSYNLTASFQRESNFAASDYLCKLDFQNAAGENIGTTHYVDLSPVVPVASGTPSDWYECTTGDVVAPDGAEGYIVVFEATSMTAGGVFGINDASLVQVPEPVSVALLGLGIGFIYLLRRKLKK